MGTHGKLALAFVAAVAVAGLAAVSHAGGEVTWEWNWLPTDPDWVGAGASGILEDGTAVGSATIEAPSQYRVVRWKGGEYEVLPPPGANEDTSCIGWKGNPRGQIAGYYFPWPDAAWFHAALWDARDGSAVDVHPTGPVEGVAWDVSLAYAINKRGDMVGSLSLASDYWVEIPYVWTDGGAGGHALPVPEGMDSGRALDISDDGSVAGLVLLRDGAGQFACLWEADGDFVDLHAEVLAAYPDLDLWGSGASSVASDGTVTIIGFRDTADTEPISFVWTRKAGARVLDSGSWTSGWAFESAGRYVAGELGGLWYVPEELTRGAIWVDEVLHVIDPPSGYGWTELPGVNVHGDVVGTAYPTEEFPWVSNGRPFVLRRTKAK